MTEKARLDESHNQRTPCQPLLLAAYILKGRWLSMNGNFAYLSQPNNTVMVAKVNEVLHFSTPVVAPAHYLFREK